MFKRELRSQALLKQRALEVRERVRLSSDISRNLFLSVDFSVFRLVHIFLSIERNNEIETGRIIKTLRNDFPKIEIAVPCVVDGSPVLENRLIDENTKISDSSWGIPQPTDGEIVDPANIDAVIVPLLAFDRRGHRVGYGKGFYDRFLSKCRSDCLKIGVSYFDPVDEITDINENDVPLDYCCTPSELFRF